MVISSGTNTVGETVSDDVSGSEGVSGSDGVSGSGAVYVTVTVKSCSVLCFLPRQTQYKLP